jgi:dolichyl-phosphate-mannose--protein O-mannosyl transferase
MSNDIANNKNVKTAERLPRRNLLPLPGLAAISLYLLFVSACIIFGVVVPHTNSPLFLLLAAAFITAAAGLLLLFRWAWAMALGAIFLMVVYNLWSFAGLHEPSFLLQGLLNLVFFLYLIRAEVRNKLR